MKNRFLKYIFIAVVALSVVSSCATRRKLANLMSEDSTTNVQLALANEADYLPEMKNDLKASRDTLTVKDDDGREFLLMKAVKDEETGEMVATEVIDAAKVTARFRNVAERHGKVEPDFIGNALHRAAREGHRVREREDREHLFELRHGIERHPHPAHDARQGDDDRGDPGCRLLREERTEEQTAGNKEQK